MAMWKLIPLFLSAAIIPFSAKSFAGDAVIKKPTKPATVRHVGDSKRGPYVVIDHGAKRGFVIGLDLCLYDDLGQETGCGVVEESSPRAAGIRLPKEKPYTVVEGNRAWSMAWGALPPPDGYAVDDEGDVEQLVEEQQEEEPAEPSLLKRQVSYQYYTAYVLPVATNALEFDAQARASGAGTVWKSGETSKKSLIGLAVNLRLPRPGYWDTGIVLGYSFMQQIRAKTDFDLTDNTQFVETGVSAHFYRLGWSKGYSLVHWSQSDWMISGGFDAWFVMHKFQATHADSSSLATGSIYNGLLTAPVSTWYEFTGGGWTWTTGVEVHVPIVMRGSRVSGQVGYAEETTATKDLESIGKAISPTKGMGFAFKLGLGAKI